ncbi:MAG: flavodoxin family protein, partial [Firmicutes bacterium]|nr:flavodoxin family protein [Bacillota bacterium]
MKILVITGSGRRKGTSAYLADEFIRGCRDAGNEVWRFDAAFSNIKPCMGCGTCRETDSCIWDDDFHKVASYLTEADEIVLATPVYYMGMTSQLKMVIDRMYQLESKP